MNMIDSFVNNSRLALISAIEIHNKPIFPYRYEVVCILVINAWELLFKAYLLHDFRPKIDRDQFKLNKHPFLIMKKESVQTILKVRHNINVSNLSVNKYFEVHDVPFSRVQYYTYCKLLKKYGEHGLRDRREEGKNPKLTPRIHAYILLMGKHEPSISTKELRARIQEDVGTEWSKSRVNNFRKAHGLRAQKPARHPCHLSQPSGGGELLTGLAVFSGSLDIFRATIMERIREIRQAEAFLPNQQHEQATI